MLDRNDLELILRRMQRSIRKADPDLARSLVAEPRRNPDEPFLFEYLDRLIAALTLKIADPNQAARRQMKAVLRYVRRIRLTSAEEWDLR